MKRKRKDPLEIAYSILKRVADKPKNPKFKNLGATELYRAQRIKKENNLKKVRFKRYKRGSIVMVDFGVNTGNEMSGVHFAITLTKHDHPYKGTLTVIPLSSKNKPYYLPLQKDMIQIIFDKIMKDAFKVEELHAIALSILQHKEIYHKHDSGISYTMSSPVFNELLREINKDYDLLNPIDFTIVLDNIEQKIKQMDEVYNHYSRFINDSYAHIDGITQVSKFKILKPVNDYDPIGKTQIPISMMEKIEFEIVKRFLGQNWVIDK